MKKYIAGILSIALFCVACFSVQQVKSAGARDITVDTEYINVREGPGLSNAVIDKVYRGETYTVVSTDQEWLEIQLSKNKTGWVAEWLVTDSTSAIQTSAEETAKKKTVDKTGLTLAGNLNVRSTPSASSDLLGKLNKDVQVSIHSLQGEWAEITFKGENGWISTSFLAIDGEQKGTITASELDVHDSASLNGKKIGTVKQGESFTILKEKNNMTKIQYTKKKTGWVASWYLKKQGTKAEKSSSSEQVKDSSIVILQDGTNLRSKASADSKVVKRVNEGDTFSLLAIKGNWYKVELKNGDAAYVAGWVVSVKGQAHQIEKTDYASYLTDKLIVLDPGHGGRDQGTVGPNGTLEKDLTQKTAQLLQSKLEAAGAHVILTRSKDTYVALPSRVRVSHINAADAFISLHYDSTEDQSTTGLTSYYYHSFQQPLSKALNASLSSALNIKNRGYRYGDYHVLRENNRNATLLELGYLSNPVDELRITSSEYQDVVTNAIFTGLAKYFK